MSVETTQVLEKLDKFHNDYGNTLKEVQDRMDLMEKSGDTALKQGIEELKEANTQAVESISNAKAELKALHERQDEIEKLAARPGNGAKGAEMDELAKKWFAASTEYIRKGTAPEEGLYDEVCKTFAKCHVYDSEEAILKETEAFKREMSSGKRAIPMFSPDEFKTMRTDINPDGGYWVQPQRIDSFFVDRFFETSPVRSAARIITTTTNEVEIIIDDNEAATGGWVGEQQQRTSTDTPQVGLKVITPHEQYAEPKISQKMLDDSSINVEEFLNRKVSDIITRTENTAFVIGDGSKKPKGFLSYPNWTTPGVYERDAIEQIPSGTPGAVNADGIINLQNAVKAPYQARSIYMMERATWGDVLKLKDGNGRYLLNFELLPRGAGQILQGKPVVFADDMPSVGNGSLSIAYGDFSVGYTIVDRIGIRVIRDEVTDKPNIKFYTTKRVGGDVTNFEAIKLQVLSA